MRLVIEGHHLPGRSCGCYDDVHVGVQVRRDPADLVAADAESATWEVEVEVVDRDGETDFRGPAVQGRRGERFVYLTWGEGVGEAFTMFRRAKLMLSDVPDPAEPIVTARVDLTDEAGMPRCARLRPPALGWA
ncbi:DUF5990 family protein [Marmoricola sp. URHB0036]|uniref:DUF5990 family protein n=1 Tax=Marmoricola sp. URHB0036 TaxID=1298863 RepID=UPI000419EEC7|nr:DUF5990 family protein [Marmoricola sp. URHB0036]